MKTTTLEYHGRIMTPEPINMAFDSLCETLISGHPAIAQLEPGDGTHYCLLIVPVWAVGVRRHLGRYGILAGSAESYMIVMQMDDRGGKGFYSFADGTEAADLRHIDNDWTRDVFSWWSTLLWDKLRSHR